MSTLGPFHEIFPNEVIRMFLAPLSYKQLKGLQRVAFIWNYLSNTGLLSLAELKGEYSYLMTESEIEALKEEERRDLIANQEEIYADLARRKGLLPGDSRKERLKAFAKGFSSFSESQKLFLREMRVATGMIADDAALRNKGRIFILMAKIGNVRKLKEWSENAGAAISNEDKEEALNGAAENGHLPCVRYLIEEAAMILNYDKGRALEWAAGNGHLPCVQHLIETCKEIAKWDKQGALERAEKNKHNEVA